MIDDPFRKILPKYTKFIIGFYQGLGLTPNQITLVGLAISMVSAFLVARGDFLEGLVVWWVGRLADGTDGIYARQTGQATPFGAYLDIVCDMLSYSMMILAFAKAHPDLDFFWQLILVLYILCITSALALGSIEEKTSLPTRDNRGLRLGAGLAEGGETGIAYSLFLLVPQFIRPLVLVWLAILITTVVAGSLFADRLCGQDD